MNFTDEVLIPMWCCYGEETNAGAMGCWSLMSGYIVDGKKYCINCDMFNNKVNIDSRHEVMIQNNQFELKRTIKKCRGGSV